MYWNKFFFPDQTKNVQTRRSKCAPSEEVVIRKCMLLIDNKKRSVLMKPKLKVFKYWVVYNSTMLITLRLLTQ